MYRAILLVLAIAAAGQAEEAPPANSRLANYCPSTDGYWTTFVRDVRSCVRYYKCSNGRKIAQHCPPGLFFNPKKLVCDYPERAGCHILLKRSVDTFDAVEDGPHLAKECPKQDGVWPTYLINPKDCSSFYECSHGKPYLKRCQKGTEFDAKRLVCDRPEDAKCKPKAALESAPVVEDEELEDGPHIGKWCPRVDGRWPTYLVNRWNCHRYFECSNGRPIPRKCPGRLVFNPKKLTCDRWENVRCRPWLP